MKPVVAPEMAWFLIGCPVRLASKVQPLIRGAAKIKGVVYHSSISGKADEPKPEIDET